MKYACDKCLRVIRDYEMKNCLRCIVKSDTPGGDKNFLLCESCKPQFWEAVEGDLSVEVRNGKS